MAPSEIAAFMRRHALYQAEMMAYLDIGERTLRRYLRGTAPIPVPIVLLLRALDQLGEPPFLSQTAIRMLEREGCSKR